MKVFSNKNLLFYSFMFSSVFFFTKNECLAGRQRRLLKMAELTNQTTLPTNDNEQQDTRNTVQQQIYNILNDIKNSLNDIKNSLNDIKNSLNNNIKEPFQQINVKIDNLNNNFIPEVNQRISSLESSVEKLIKSQYRFIINNDLE